MASFRGSSHNLMIETGRYHISREFRSCPYCECIVEEDCHFLFVCPLYNNIRIQYIDTNFLNPPNSDRLNALMASSVKQHA